MTLEHPKLDYSDLVSFPIGKIVDNSVTDFDVFVKVSDHLILYGASGYRWMRRELTDLLKNGVSNFHIRLADQRKAEIYSEIARIPEIDRSLKPVERIVSIEQIGTEFTKALYNGEITTACVEKAKSIADGMLACIAEDRRCIQALASLNDHDNYTYSHSIRVASLSLAIALEMGVSNVDVLRDLALGAMFHDIGKKNIPLYVLNKPGALTDDEWKQLRAHPEGGFQHMESIIQSTVPREIILHHHEKLDGSGYPHGLDGSSLLIEVQIATLADVYDALTSARAYQFKRSRFDGLDFIRVNMLGSKLAKDPYQALISCLHAS